MTKAKAYQEQMKIARKLLTSLAGRVTDSPDTPETDSDLEDVKAFVSDIRALITRHNIRATKSTLQIAWEKAKRP